MSFETLTSGFFQWNLPAWIEDDAGALQPCTVREMSKKSAKLALAGAQEVPSAFVLRLTESGSLARDCRIVSRSPSEISVEFAALKYF